MLISKKGIFKFDPETKELYLAQIHPGISLDDVKKDVPWDLKITENLTETAPPSQKEVSFIRKFAPTESVGRELALELSTAHIMKKMEARQKPE